MTSSISPELLLHAYKIGVFPMADSRDAPDVHWVEPKMRGIIPLDGFHISKSLKRSISKQNYDVSINTRFEDVVECCADRPETWINAPIFKAYRTLFQAGFAHSLEISANGQLIGGVYGVALGSAFFGESMFSRRTDASKIALAYLVHRLKNTGFILFDTQFITPHLARLGGIEIPQIQYKSHLAKAITGDANFCDPNYSVDASAIAQRSTQTS